MSQKIEKYDFKIGLPQEIEIVDTNKLYAISPEKLTSLHRTGFYMIIWFRKGGNTHFVDFKPVKIKEDTLLFLNKDMVHRFDKNGNFEAKALLFTENFFCKNDEHSKFLRKSSLFNDFFSVSQIAVQASKTPFSEVFQQIEKELQRDKDGVQSDILRNLLYNVLLYATREIENTAILNTKKDIDFEVFLRFKDLLDHHFKQQKKVSDYTTALGVTEKKLNQITTKITDKSPKKIIDERTMLEAKRLLAYTHDSVKEIGYFLGFDEPTNFIKFFKKHDQNTPLEFREQTLLA